MRAKNLNRAKRATSAPAHSCSLARMVRCPLCDGERKITASIGGTILMLRTRRGLTQEGLAKAAKLAKGYMSELERGNQDNPSIKTLMAVASVLGMKASELVACHEKRVGTSNAKDGREGQRKESVDRG